jgi:hypothetical protein
MLSCRFSLSEKSWTLASWPQSESPGLSCHEARPRTSSKRWAGSCLHWYCATPHRNLICEVNCFQQARINVVGGLLYDLMESGAAKQWDELPAGGMTLHKAAAEVG